MTRLLRAILSLLRRRKAMSEEWPEGGVRDVGLDSRIWGMDIVEDATMPPDVIRLVPRERRRG